MRERAPEPVPEKEAEVSPGRRRTGLPPVLLAAFAAGLVALGSEVLWTRMLTFFLEGFTYTFSAMLSTFLLGLALGALVSGIFVDRIRDLRRYVGVLFAASALVSGGVLFALTRHFEITDWSKDLTAGLFGDWRTHHAASLFVASFVTLFPPALVMGGIFPAVARLGTRSAGEVGSRVGLVYSANTVGSVVGALAAGLVLTRLVGMAWGAALLAMGGLLAGVLLIGLRGWPLWAPAALGLVGLVVWAEPSTPFIRHSHVFRGERGLERELVSYEEGVYGAVSVVENVRNGVKAIYTDEFQAAATGPQYKYMRMLAHLPLLLAPRWEGAETLVICFGTGTTAGSAAAHPLGRLDVVEISPEVLAQAHRFRHVNKGILDDDPDRGFPVGVHVDDGRNFLLRSDRTWDVITLEPLMPYTPGSVTLYTEDFYRLCRDRLAPEGLACQWIPIHAMSHENYRMLVRSFVEVFPESSLWLVEGTSMIIGSREELPLDYARLALRMEHPAVSADLGAIEFADPRLVVNTFVASGGDLRDFVEDSAIMTDEHPTMEFLPVPFKWPNSYLADNLAVLHDLRRPVVDRLDLSALPEAERRDLGREMERFYRGGQAFLEALHHKAASAYWGTQGKGKLQEEHYRYALAAYDAAVKDVPEDGSARYLRRNALYGWWISMGLAELERENYGAAAAEFLRASRLENPFRSDLAWTLLGRTYNRMGRHRSALGCLEEALARFPRSPDALAERGYAWFELGRVRSALADFHAAFESSVPPEVDAGLLAAKKRAFQMERKGLVPEDPPVHESAREIVAGLRAATGAAARELLAELQTLYAVDPDTVRAVLAPEVERARDPSAPAAEQELALRILSALGDLPGTLDLLRTGVPAVREKAADVLARVERVEVVPALIEAMDDGDRGVREAAWAALFGLTGERPEGYEPDAPEEVRRAAVEELRAWWREVEPGWEF
jgi:spermidine synthase/tetratricopeptide (TPR) repeat protein